MNAERIFGAFLFAEDWQPWSPSEASSQFDVLAARGVNAVFTDSRGVVAFPGSAVSRVIR